MIIGSILLGIVVFSIGIFGLLRRRNIVSLLMSLELLLNAVNLIFLAGSSIHKNLSGQLAVFFVITVAACEASLGLALVIAFFRRFGSIETDDLRLLKG